MVERVVLYYGPDKGFRDLVNEEIGPEEKTVEFLSLIRKYNYRIRSNDYGTNDYESSRKPEADNGVVHAVDFGSAVDHVMSNFAAIVTQAYDVRNLFVQNPPDRVRASLESAYPDAVEVREWTYESVGRDDIRRIHRALEDGVIGQESGKREIALSLYKLHVMGDGTPSVLLFYGPSGVGKTESARCLSDAMGGGLTRVQMSMMHSTEAYEYIFGAEHSKGSFARDLLSRESNVVLLDEFDKVRPELYNAFYQLFDEGVFVDTNYRVDMRGSIFVLTTNFGSESEVEKRLGTAMFSRIGSCVEFDGLSPDAKRKIAGKYLERLTARLDDADRGMIEETDMVDWFLDNAERYDNMRIMKSKIDRAVFGYLTDRLLEDDDTGALG